MSIFLLIDIWVISHLNKSAINILVQVFWEAHARISLVFLLDIYLGVQLLGHTEGVVCFASVDAAN